MYFSVKQYNPAAGRDVSGAYIFRPKLEDQTKHDYSAFQSYERTAAPSTGIQAFAIYFNEESTGKMYTTLIRAVPHSASLEWKVLLHGIPIDDGYGKEVVVYWQIPGI